MTTYVSYCRVSTRKQGESGLGLEAQMSIIRHYYPSIEKEFTDVRSGKDIKNRPALKEAIEYCKATGAILVAAKTDRLSRNVDDGRWVLEQLGGKLRLCDIPGEVDKFTYTLFLSFAEREREIIRLRIKNALDAKKARGEKWNQDRKIAISYVERSALIRVQAAVKNEYNIRAKSYAKSLLDQGKTFREIADHLNESGFKTSLGNKWTSGTAWRLAVSSNTSCKTT